MVERDNILGLIQKKERYSKTMETCFEWGSNVTGFKRRNVMFWWKNGKICLARDLWRPYPQTHIPVWVTANPGGSSAFWSSIAVWRLSELPKLNPRWNARGGNAAPGWVLGTMQNPQARGEASTGSWTLSWPWESLLMQRFLELFDDPLMFRVTSNGQRHHTLLCVQT